MKRELKIRLYLTARDLVGISLHFIYGTRRWQRKMAMSAGTDDPQPGDNVFHLQRDWRNRVAQGDANSLVKLHVGVIALLLVAVVEDVCASYERSRSFGAALPKNYDYGDTVSESTAQGASDDVRQLADQVAFGEMTLYEYVPEVKSLICNAHGFSPDAVSIVIEDALLIALQQEDHSGIIQIEV